MFTSNDATFRATKDPSYPKMIELFARTEFPLREPNVLTPIHIDDDIVSLSGILLNEDYYSVLLKGRTVIDGLSVLDRLLHHSHVIKMVGPSYRTKDYYELLENEDSN